jgi:hypothetical protein
MIPKDVENIDATATRSAAGAAPADYWCEACLAQTEGVRRFRLGSWWVEGAPLRSAGNLYCRGWKLIAGPSINRRGPATLYTQPGN